MGKVTRAQVKKIAEIKMPDLNAADLDSAMRMIAGDRPVHGAGGRGLMATQGKKFTGGRGQGRSGARVPDPGGASSS